MEKRDLSRPKQWLIEQCQRINFGRLTFAVRGGEPDLRQSYRAIRTVRTDAAENGSRRELARSNFELRKEQIALLMQLAGLPDGTRVTVKLIHGLPGSTIDIEEEHKAA